MGNKYLVLAKRPSQTEWETSEPCATIEEAVMAIKYFQNLGMWIIDLYVRDPKYDRPELN